MKTQVPGAETFCRRDLRWRIGRKAAGLRVESELENYVGTRVVPRRLQDIVVEAGDVRHKGEAVGPIRLDGMRAARRGLPVEQWCADGAVRSERMDGRVPA